MAKRTVPILGAILLGAGLLSALASFPFIAGEPDANGDPADPAWFHALAPFVIGAMILGVVLIGGTVAHDLAVRRNGPG